MNTSRKKLKCGRKCIPQNPEDCSHLISDVVNGGLKLKVDIVHEDKAWFNQFKLLRRMGGGKSGALVYRTLFHPSQTTRGAAADVLRGVSGFVVGGSVGAAYGLWNNGVVEGAKQGAEKGKQLLMRNKQPIKRTVALKLYFDAFDRYGNVNNTRPFREVDAQCKLSGHRGFNCQLAVKTLRWGDIKNRLFRTGKNTSVPKDGSADYVEKKDMIEDEIGIFKEGTWPEKNETLEPDIYTIELPYIPKHDNQKVLVMVTDWTPGQPLLNLDLSQLERSQLLGLFLELAAVWQRGYHIFKEDKHFAHWDLHPDNIFVNLDPDCAPRGNVRLPVEATLKRARGLVQTFLVASLPPSSRDALVPKLKQALVSTFDGFLEAQLGHLVYQNARSGLGLVKEAIQEKIPQALDKSLKDLEALLLEKLNKIVPKTAYKNSQDDNLKKKAIRMLRESAQVAIRSAVRYLRRLFLQPDLVLRFPQVTVIDFDLLTSERMFRLEVEHTGKLKSMVPITERAVAFLLRNVPTEVGVAWIRALSAMFRDFPAKERPYYLVDLNHLLTYMFVLGVHYQVPQEMKKGGVQALHTYLQVGHSMVNSFASIKAKLQEFLRDPTALFWKILDRSIQLRQMNVWSAGREVGHRLATGLEEATWGALAASFGIVSLDMETVRSVRNVVLGRQNVRSLIGKQVRRALGLDPTAKEMLRIFFQNYLFHVSIACWTKFKAFPNQDTLGIDIVPKNKKNKKKPPKFRDLTVILLAGDYSERLKAFFNKLPDDVKSKLDPNIMKYFNSSVAKAMELRPTTILNAGRKYLNVAAALAYDTTNPPRILLSLKGGSDFQVQIQGELHLKLGYANLENIPTDKMRIPSNSLYPGLRSLLYMRGGLEHSTLNKFAVKLEEEQDSVRETDNEALMVFSISNLKLNFPSGGMKIEADFSFNKKISTSIEGEFLINVLYLLGTIVNVDVLGTLGFAASQIGEFGIFIMNYVKKNSILQLMKFLLDKVFNSVASGSSAESDFAPRSHVEIMETRQKDVYRVVVMTYNMPPNDLVKCATAIGSGNLSDALDCLSFLFSEGGSTMAQKLQKNAIMCLLKEELGPWFGNAKIRIVNQMKVDGQKKVEPLADLLQMDVTHFKNNTGARTMDLKLLPGMYTDPWMNNDAIMWGITKVLYAFRTKLTSVKNYTSMQSFLTQQQERMEQLSPPFVLRLWSTSKEAVEMLWSKILRVWTEWMESSQEHDVTYLFVNPSHTQRTLQNIVREACGLLLVEVAEGTMGKILRCIQDRSMDTFSLKAPQWTKLTTSNVEKFQEQWEKLMSMVQKTQVTT